MLGENHARPRGDEYLQVWYLPFLYRLESPAAEVGHLQTAEACVLLHVSQPPRFNC